MSLFRLCSSITSHPFYGPWLKRIAIVAPAVVTFATLLAIRFYFGRHGVHMPHQIVFACLIPPAFALWMSVWDEGNPPEVLVSPLIGMMVFPILLLAGVATAYPLWVEYRALSTLVAVVASILLFSGIKRPAMAVYREPVAALLALLLASLLYVHAFLHESFWSFLCESTANVINAMSKIVGFEIDIISTEDNLILLNTDTFSAMLAPPCSGMDGMAIFFGLMTVVFLFDWKLFKYFSLARLYVAGFFIIFLINALRILVLFSVGTIGAHPNAPEWLKPFKEVMFTMFHDHIGWTVYVVTFAVFVTPLYRMAIERGSERS